MCLCVQYTNKCSSILAGSSEECRPTYYMLFCMLIDSEIQFTLAEIPMWNKSMIKFLYYFIHATDGVVVVKEMKILRCSYQLDLQTLILCLISLEISLLAMRNNRTITTVVSRVGVQLNGKVQCEVVFSMPLLYLQSKTSLIKV